MKVILETKDGLVCVVEVPEPIEYIVRIPLRHGKESGYREYLIQFKPSGFGMALYLEQ